MRRELYQIDNFLHRCINFLLYFSIRFWFQKGFYIQLSFWEKHVKKLQSKYEATSYILSFCSRIWLFEQPYGVKWKGASKSWYFETNKKIKKITISSSCLLEESIRHSYLGISKLSRTRGPGKWNNISYIINSSCKLHEPLKSKPKTSMRNYRWAKVKFTNFQKKKMT